MKHFIAGLTACILAAGAAAGIAAARADSAATAPDAATLSFTAAQVASGKDEYAASCIDCHGPNLNDGEFGGPPLKGDAFAAKWFGKPASGLIGYVSTAMPLDSPGRLPLGTYVEIVAYLLSVNGVAPGAHAVPADMDALGKLTIPAGAAKSAP